MIRKLPVLATIVVAAAVALMLYLGFWQLDRMEEKNQLLAAYADNFDRPPVHYPELGPVADEVMFRKSSVNCLRVSDWEQRGGRAADGSQGYRYLARCVTGAEGPGALVTLGVGSKPGMAIEWAGGELEGIITQAPSESSLLDSMLGKAVPPGPMLVVSEPVAGLKTPKAPSIKDIPNNHLAYAVQWFLFAGIALIIYFFAVRLKLKAAEKENPENANPT